MSGTQYPREIQDPRIEECEKKIRNNKYQIEKYERKIVDLKEEIEELKKIRSKIFNLQNEIDASVSKSESKVNNIVGMIFNAISVIKGTLFFSILDVIKGPQRTQADNGLASSLSKINKKIKEFEKEIENLSTQINQLTTDNFILQTKIMHYKANPLPTM